MKLNKNNLRDKCDKYSFIKSIQNTGNGYVYFVYNVDNFSFFRYVPNDYSISVNSDIDDIHNGSNIYNDIKILEKFFYTYNLFSIQQKKIYMRCFKIEKL